MSEHRVVYKYRFEGNRIKLLGLLGPLVVHAGMDNTHAECVWIEQWLDQRGPEKPPLASVDLELILVGTGSPIPPHFTHAKTFINLPHVWHVYQQRTS